MENDVYKPIACESYDLFEIAGSRKTLVELKLTDGSIVTGKIETLTSKKGDGEYVVFHSGEQVRLDKVEKINNTKVGFTC